jgi:hypothetical protein
MNILRGRGLLLILFVFAASPGLKGQTLLSQALSSFPQNTIRIEYSHPSVLRALPDYSALRQRYEGPKLQELETSFAKLGIQESDVDELMLGWRVEDKSWSLFGLTTGRFDGQALAARAASERLTAYKVGEPTAYCAGNSGSANCVVVLSDSLGAFGTLDSLRAVMETRAGRQSAIGAEKKFTTLLDQVESRDPIWGVAVGPAVPDWYQGWMPNQSDMKVDWAEAFKPVESLIYGINPGETVHLNIAMDCATAADAQNLKRAFDGMRLYQQLSWQNQNPGRPNPFKNLEITGQDNHILIKLETAYGDLIAPEAPGSGKN